MNEYNESSPKPKKQDKPKFKGRIKLTYNMGYSDLERYDGYVKRMSYWISLVRKRNPDAMIEFWADAATFYDEIRCFCGDDDQTIMDDNFNKINEIFEKNVISHEPKIMDYLAKALPIINRQMHELRKKLNLIVPWQKIKSEGRRADESLGIDKNEVDDE